MKDSVSLTLERIGHFLSKLAEKSDSVYWLSSPDFRRIIYISPAYEKIWGRSREELYKNPELWIQYLVPDDVSGYNPITAMAERVEKLGPAARYDESYRIIRPDGEIRWIYDRGFPIYNEQGECCGVTGIAIDVTKELRQAEERAEIANKAKSDFIANMSHDLRTPLNGILGLSTILLSRKQDDENRGLLERIKQAGENLLFLLNEILDLCELENGNIPIQESEFDLKKLVFDLRSLLLTQAQEKDINIIVDYPKTVPVTVVGDKHRVHRILLNLINNAIKFTEQGFVEISVKQPPSNTEISYLAISVQDSGIGIPADKIEYIFERFTRLEPSHSGKHRGSGLGLGIVKQFIKDINGEINVVSEVNKGSTFTCTLPFKFSPSSIATETIPQAEPCSENMVQKVALVIEDDLISQLVMKSLLTDYGFKVIIAGNAAQAMASLQHKFDIIFTDIGLPDKNGIELSREIRGIGLNKVPIIAVTAHLSKKRKEDCLAAGIQAIFNKPLSKEDCFKIISTYLQIA